LPLFQGTYWYHSHYQAQYCDGLRGALVIYDPNDPQASLYDVDDGEIHTRFEYAVGELIPFNLREHYYHTCGLVPLLFITGAVSSVSLFVTLVEL
jgi:hypothetical protein